MKICILTLGCKVNQYESDMLMRRLKARGHEVTDVPGPCDAVLLATCAVTKEAERKSRQMMAKIRAFSPSARVVVAGCASQQSDGDFRDKGAFAVLGTSGRARAVALLEGEGGGGVMPQSLDYEELWRPEDGTRQAHSRTRAYIKVQDGCGQYCSYCLIPYLRGESRSRPVGSVLSEIESLAGVKEFVLTGINLSAYGGEAGLQSLIRALYGVAARIRLGSLETGVVTADFLDALQGLQAFCPHFHLSLQSGSDKVLADMNRRYKAEDFLNSVRLIRERFPDAAVTTDIICGFPTETEADFEQTLAVCRAAAFADMHIFGYSPRPGTAAARDHMPLPPDTVKAREQRLGALKQTLKTAFLTSFMGKPLSVLTESGGKGYSENYILCYTDGAPENTVAAVRPYALHGDGVKAEII